MTDGAKLGPGLRRGGGVAGRLFLCLVVLVGCACLSLRPASAAELTIGVVELADDVRYRESRTFARHLSQPLGRPFAGAETALGEVSFHGVQAGVTFALRRLRVDDPDALPDMLDAAIAGGIRFLLADLPAEALSRAVAATAGRDVLLFNVSAGEDVLRAGGCAPHLLHTVPSDAMLADALAQYLASRRWRDVLALVGPTARDKVLHAAFVRAAKRYGLKIVDERDFLPGGDPRQRRRNNLLLLTQGDDYDVIHIADNEGDVARALSYSTYAPRPVVGSDGLAALAWHWAWERHGAPQLEARFEKKSGRAMQSVDWAAWIAVKAVAEAVQRTGSAEFASLRDYLLDPELVLDGFKGNRMNFRRWNNQLRQPLLVATHNWVVSRAPVEAFVHQHNNLDTLGYDEPESRCRLR